jgi:hypothetical protein
MANRLSVNLLAPILLVQVLLPMMTPGARVVFAGSTSGLDNFGCPEVANAASKFGLRGAAQALAVALHPRVVGFTVINSGNVATKEVEQDIVEGKIGAQTPIPMGDLLHLTLCCACHRRPSRERSIWIKCSGHSVAASSLNRYFPPGYLIDIRLSCSAGSRVIHADERATASQALQNLNKEFTAFHNPLKSAAWPKRPTRDAWALL